MSDEDQTKTNCSMVGLLGILIQIGLGALSFSVLIIKRYFQHPKRPWKIWAFDASKQMISQTLAHFINLTISLALSYNRKNSDECLWYFVTNIFDNTMGVFICIVMLELIEKCLKKKRKFQFISGNYYRKIDPLSLTHQQNSLKQNKESFQIKPNHNIQIQMQQLKKQNLDKRKSLILDGDSRMHALNIQIQNKALQQQINQNNVGDQFVENNFIYIIDYKAWIVQLAIWNGIVILGKCVLFGLQFGLEKQLQDFSIMILGWIQDYPVLQLLVVMVVVPVIMNGLAYWVQDNFLMKKQKQTQQKNLIQQNMKQNSQNVQQFGGNTFPSHKQQKQKSIQQKNQKYQKQNQFSKNVNRFEFHDDYDAKDQQNADKNFEKLDKFGKFAL